jgi:integrase
MTPSSFQSRFKCSSTHSFRATGVTEYMNSGGTIEIAQRIAGHTSPATTRIYDRSGDRLTLEEIERVQIGKKRQI